MKKLLAASGWLCAAFTFALYLLQEVRHNREDTEQARDERAELIARLRVNTPADD